MEFDDRPEELYSEPEKRLSGTFITLKPKSSSLIFTALSLLIVIGVSQFYWMNIGDLAHFMPAIKKNIFFEGEWWRLFTSVLIHADFGHLLSNLYMLGIFAYFVYGYFGFYAFPVLAFFGSGLVNAISIYTYPLETRLLGASGMVYLLGGFWLSLYLMIQRQYKFSRRLVRVLGIALMVFFPSSFEPTTSYRTHFIGFAVGATLGLLYFFFNKDRLREKETFKWLYLD